MRAETRKRFPLLLYLMKKIGALSFAAFYLMLTTGLFVCLLHCSLASTFTFDAQDVHMNTQKGGISESFILDKDCDCCQHHGEYTVKENIKSSATAGLKARYLLSAASQTVFSYLIRSESIASIGKWRYHSGTPVFKKTPIYLSNGVLII